VSSSIVSALRIVFVLRRKSPHSGDNVGSVFHPIRCRIFPEVALKEDRQGVFAGKPAGQKYIGDRADPGEGAV